MTDIVERLRVPIFEIGLDETVIEAQRNKAADEIERLRAALVADWPYPASEGWGEEMAGRIAAAEDIRALKGKE